MTPTEALNHYFGYNTFKAGQKQIIDLVLAQQNTFMLPNSRLISSRLDPRDLSVDLADERSSR